MQSPLEIEWSAVPSAPSQRSSWPMPCPPPRERALGRGGGNRPVGARRPAAIAALSGVTHCRIPSSFRRSSVVSQKAASSVIGPNSTLDCAVSSANLTHRHRVTVDEVFSVSNDVRRYAYEGTRDLVARCWRGALLAFLVFFSASSTAGRRRTPTPLSVIRSTYSL